MDGSLYSESLIQLMALLFQEVQKKERNVRNNEREEKIIKKEYEHGIYIYIYIHTKYME